MLLVCISNPILARLRRASMGQLVLLTPQNPSHPKTLLSRQHFAHISPLDATLIGLLASVANKRLTDQLNPLDATLTKNTRGLPTLPFLSALIFESIFHRKVIYERAYVAIPRRRTIHQSKRTLRIHNLYRVMRNFAGSRFVPAARSMYKPPISAPLPRPACVTAS